MKKRAPRPRPKRLSGEALAEWEKARKRKVRGYVYLRNRRLRHMAQGIAPLVAAGDPENARRGLEKLHGVVPLDRRCTAENKDGSRCKLWAVRGSHRCSNHEGVELAPWSKAAARRHLSGTLQPPKGRFKDHPSIAVARLGSPEDEPEGQD